VLANESEKSRLELSRLAAQPGVVPTTIYGEA
jgi:hypothetical protein